MSDRFSDDKFIEAARVYQNIKAPSDLRERVLKGAAEETAAERSGAVQLPERRTKHVRGKIYRAASLAACMAIMVAALPNWMPDIDADNPPDVSPRGIIEEEILPQPDEGNLPGIELAQIEGGIPAASDVEKDAEPYKPEEDPEPATEPIKPAETPEASVYEVRPSDAETDDAEEDFAENEEAESEDAGRGGIAISVGKLLPAMAVEGSLLQDMEVRLMDAKDGTCTVEITTADSKTTEITVSKNVEDGHWEITGAAEE